MEEMSSSAALFWSTKCTINVLAEFLISIPLSLMQQMGRLEVSSKDHISRGTVFGEPLLDVFCHVCLAIFLNLPLDNCGWPSHPNGYFL